jgi:hypothetical protein
MDPQIRQNSRHRDAGLARLSAVSKGIIASSVVAAAALTFYLADATPGVAVSSVNPVPSGTSAQDPSQLSSPGYSPSPYQVPSDQGLSAPSSPPQYSNQRPRVLSSATGR